LAREKASDVVTNKRLFALQLSNKLHATDSLFF
jgi:hypothetical protein